MKIGRASALKLVTFTSVAAVAAAAHRFGLGDATGWLATFFALGAEGALALTGHFGTHLLDTTIDHHASDVEKRLRAGQNRDLHRLIGEVIATILKREAKHAPGRRYGKKYLVRAAASFRSGEWMSVELTGPEVSIGEPAIASYFTGGADPIRRAPVLEQAEWFALVEKVAGRATPGEYYEALTFAANKLREHFASELWDAAKLARKEDDPAWAALILRLLSLILGQASNAARGSAVTVGQLSELRASVAAISAAINETVAESAARSEIQQSILRYQNDLASALAVLDSRIERLHTRHDQHDQDLSAIKRGIAPELAVILSLRIWRGPDECLQGVAAPRGLPLRRNDRVQIELRANQEAFFYVLWITSEGVLQPLFPWTSGNWEPLPASTPVRSIILPAIQNEGSNAWTVNTPSGFETIAVLARDVSLGEASVDLVQSLPKTLGRFPVVTDFDSLPTDRSFTFHNYRRSSLRPDRPRLNLSPVRVEDPEEQVRRIFARLEERLGVYFSLITAEAFPNRS